MENTTDNVIPQNSIFSLSVQASFLLAATYLDIDVSIPEQQSEWHSVNSGKISWYIPIPSAPIERERNILKKKPIILVENPAIVKINAPIIIGFFYSCLHLKDIYF